MLEKILNPSPTQIAFIGLLVFLAIQRLLELRHSQKNEAWIIAQGGREYFPRHFIFMKLTHTLWFFAMLAEVLLLGPAFNIYLAIPALVLTIAGQVLRYLAIRTLGKRWSVRIMALPGGPPVTGGIYKFIRHPNYLGVVLEIIAVPLLHGAFISAIVFTIMNAAVLYVRVRAEEQALREANDYGSAFAERGRFLPGL